MWVPLCRSDSVFARVSSFFCGCASDGSRGAVRYSRALVSLRVCARVHASIGFCLLICLVVTGCACGRTASAPPRARDGRQWPHGPRRLFFLTPIFWSPRTPHPERGRWGGGTPDPGWVAPPPHAQQEARAHALDCANNLRLAAGAHNPAFQDS